MSDLSHKAYIEDYNTSWPELFSKEKLRILSSLRNLALDVEHFGSTSIKGLGAKPIIDIMIGVKTVDDLPKTIKPLTSLGYKYYIKPVKLIPNRKLFKRYVDTGIGYHVHAVVFNGIFWKKHILFREYMIKHPIDAKEYLNLKRKLATKFSNDRKGYLYSKTEFIESVMEKAKAWQNDKQ